MGAIQDIASVVQGKEEDIVGVDGIYEPLDLEDPERLVTLEVAIEAQIWLANHLRYTFLPTVFYAWISGLIEVSEHLIQAWGALANALILGLGKGGFELPKIIGILSQVSFLFRVFLDALVLFNRKRIAKNASLALNGLSRKVTEDLKGSYLFSNPNGHRQRKKVYSRN